MNPVNNALFKQKHNGRFLNNPVPPVIFGTSSLGNLFTPLDEESKLDIVRACVQLNPSPVIFDSAGKYGAGLALETLGRSLRLLNVSPGEVIISNKLGWLRTDLRTQEPTFEPGVWKDIKHDAVQKISYNGILECFEQGNELLGGYVPQLVSVHDPDEYLARAESEEHGRLLFNDVIEAYKALFDLKRKGKVAAVGIGAKNWEVIQKVAAHIDLDWVMIANSMTIMHHPPALLQFIAELKQRGIFVVNSAVFHSGFLVGSNYYDYKKLDATAADNKALFEWRNEFFHVCRQFDVKPSAACIRFALYGSGADSIALNTTNHQRVKENLEAVKNKLPARFWQTLADKGLIDGQLINTDGNNI